MARRRRAQEQEEEEIVDEGVEDEGAPAGAEFVPEAALKPRADVYSLILILTFCAFLAGCIVAGREAWEHYDVQFWLFEKQGQGGAQAEDPYAQPAAPAAPAEVSDPAAAPAEPAPENP